MFNYCTEDAEDRQDVMEKVDGRIRALEAILLELVEISPDLIRAAKESIRQKWKDELRCKKLADALDQFTSRPLDEHAEAALDELIYKAERKRH
jgi:hypothetical protein